MASIPRHTSCCFPDRISGRLPRLQIHLSSLLSLILSLSLVAASSASLFSLPASFAVRALPASRLETVEGRAHEPQVPPHVMAGFEAQVPHDSPNENDTKAAIGSTSAFQNPAFSPFHVFRAPFGSSLIEIPERFLAPEIPDSELADTSDFTCSDVSDEEMPEKSAVRADALYLEETAVRSRKFLRIRSRYSSMDRCVEAARAASPAAAFTTTRSCEKSGEIERENEDCDNSGEMEREKAEERGEGEGEREAEGEGHDAQLSVPDEASLPLHVYQAADGTLTEEPEDVNGASSLLFTSLDDLYYDEVVVRTRATRATHAAEVAQLEGEQEGTAGNDDVSAAYIGPFHVFRADNGSLVEVTEPEVSLTASDGDRLPLTELDGRLLTELDQQHRLEIPVRFRPVWSAPSLTPRPRRRLRFTNDKQIEATFETAGADEGASFEPTQMYPRRRLRFTDDKQIEVASETAGGDECADVEQGEQRPVHVFWGLDGELHDEEEESSSSASGVDGEEEQEIPQRPIDVFYGLDGAEESISASGIDEEHEQQPLHLFPELAGEWWEEKEEEEEGELEDEREAEREEEREAELEESEFRERWGLGMELDWSVETPDAALDAAAEAEREYELGIAVHTRRAVFDAGEW